MSEETPLCIRCLGAGCGLCRWTGVERPECDDMADAAFDAARDKEAE